MKAIFHAVVVVVMGFIVAGYAADANATKTTIVGVGKDNSGNSTNLSTTVYSDGLGKELQTKVDVGIVSGNPTEIVTCTFYDELGKPAKATKPFRDAVSYGKFLSGSFTDINALLTNEYAQYKNGSTDPLAFSEVRYFNDPTGRTAESSLPGIENAMASGNTSRVWYFGVGRTEKTFSDVPGVSKSVKFKDGFVQTELTASEYDKLYDYFHSSVNLNEAFADNCNFYLTVTRDPAAKFAQTLQDLMGRSIANAVRIQSGENGLLVTNAEYDILGNLVKEVPPVNANPISPTSYTYNTLGYLVKKSTPDGGIDTMRYSLTGKILQVNTKSYVNGVEYPERVISYDYDAFDRVTQVRSYDKIFMSNYYDSYEDLYAKRVLYKIPEFIFPTLENLKNNLVAVVNHNLVNGKKVYIVDIFSYDDENNVKTKYKIVPGMSIQTTSFTYDNLGKVLTEKTVCGADVIEKLFEYDYLGRLYKIRHTNNGSKELVSYQYDPLGKLYQKTVNGTQRRLFTYTILDELKTSQPDAGQVGYSEELFYNVDRSISKLYTNYTGITPLPGIQQYEYTYDAVNRLKSVKLGSDVQYCDYVYDNVGRFTSKKENTGTIGSYSYYIGTNRLKTAKNSTSDDYMYDPYGNLVVDKTKKMIIEYDWRDLPVRFSFYTSIPSDVTKDTKGNCYISGSTLTLYEYMSEQIRKNNGVKLVSTSTMVYDASGNRVLKIESVN